MHVYYSRALSACLLLKGPKCCAWTLEGSPCYKGGTVVQFAQVRLVALIVSSIVKGCQVLNSIMMRSLDFVDLLSMCRS